MTIPHHQSVEMAAILGCQPATERGPPQRLEAVRFGKCGQAAEQHIDKNQAPAGIDCQVVDIQVAGGVRLGQIQVVEAVLLPAISEHVLEASHLVQAAEVQSVGHRTQPHAAVEAALKDRQLAVFLEADEPIFLS